MAKIKNVPISNNLIPYYIIIALLVAYVLFLLHSGAKNGSESCSNSPPIHIEQSVSSGSSNIDRFNDPYNPPLRNDYLSFFPGFGGYRGRGYGYGRPELDLRGSIPIPIPTNGYPLEYTQIGILTNNDNSNNNPLILPLMGRKSTSRRDKNQYYSISNTGNLNSKLAIKVKGKSCTSENGCDELYNGDEVYVDGYNSKFVSTIYENNTFQYVI
jgi:hypothetical protein